MEIRKPKDPGSGSTFRVPCRRVGIFRLSVSENHEKKALFYYKIEQGLTKRNEERK